MSAINQVPGARTGDDKIPAPTICRCKHKRHEHPRGRECVTGCGCPVFAKGEVGKK